MNTFNNFKETNLNGRKLNEEIEQRKRMPFQKMGEQTNKEERKFRKLWIQFQTKLCNRTKEWSVLVELGPTKWRKNWRRRILREYLRKKGSPSFNIECYFLY